MSQTMANLVDVRGVSFSRSNRLIFDDISLTVPRGKITAIMGPSGIGKTTLLRLIGGQIPPDSGEILFDGENIPEMSRSRLYTVRKRMSMLFQSGALFTDMNVFDNVAYPLRRSAGGCETDAFRTVWRDGATCRTGASHCIRTRFNHV